MNHSSRTNIIVCLVFANILLLVIINYLRDEALRNSMARDNAAFEQRTVSLRPVSIGDIVRFKHGPYRDKLGIIESIDIPAIKVVHLVPANTVRSVDTPREVIIWTICDISEISRLVPEFPAATK